MTQPHIAGRKRHADALEALYMHYSRNRRPATGRLLARFLVLLPLVSVALGAATIASILTG